MPIRPERVAKPDNGRGVSPYPLCLGRISVDHQQTAGR